MEVLRSTFLEKLPEVKSAIDNAAYIAIDTELTGKNVQQEWSASRCIHSTLGL
jgi:CAF1 family ribonuclease